MDIKITSPNSRAIPVHKNSKKRIRQLIKQRGLILLTLPIVIYTLIFKYIPMVGIIVAFKNYKYSKGIFRSAWCGFDNFKFLFQTNTIWNLTLRTIGYNLVFIVLGVVFPVAFALMLNELKSKIAIKTYQTTLFIPHFLSWVIVSYIVYILLNCDYGTINNLISVFGIKKIDWYSKPLTWIFIIPFVQIWKTAGYSCIIYYASLLSVSPEYYEAAAIDGASRWKMTWHISVPALIPMITILTIMSLGNIINGDFGLFYLVPQQEIYGTLITTTDIINTYVYRALKDNGNIPMSSAAGLYQSVVGFVMIIVANRFVRKYDPDRALY